MSTMGTSFNPSLAGIVNRARAMTCEDRAMTCEDWLEHSGYIANMKRAGRSLAGPCPICGGEDRFGIDLAQDKWICRGCGIGGPDAISMVVLLWNPKGDTAGQKFVSAVEMMTGESRHDAIDQAELDRREAEFKKKRAQQADYAEKMRRQSMEAALKLWKRGAPAGRHIETYHEIRGIKFPVARLLTVRECDDLEYWHDMAPKGSKTKNMQCLHKGPAMLCVVLDSAGKFAGVHRTWLDPKGKKGKAIIIKPGEEQELLESKKMLGSLADGAIRMITPRDAAGNIIATRMVIGEGYETSMTPATYEAREDTAYWCGVSMGHIAGRAARNPETNRPINDMPDLEDDRAFVLPDWVKEIVFLMDGDSDPKKTADAMKRAARRAKARNKNVIVRLANPGNGVDWNDLAMKDE